MAAFDTHEDVFDQAWGIYVERYETYGDAWAEHDLDDALMHIDSKAARVRAAAKAGNKPAAIDNALDLMNYAAFLIRRMEAELEAST
jgi:hypothetical protein